MPPKYRQLADILREKIELSREEHLKLPAERELAAMYQVSRQTVRQALEVLEEEGLIARRQGSGNYATRRKEHVRQIAVLVPARELLFSPVFREMEAVLVEEGCSLQVYSTENRISREREILQNILKAPVDGICVRGTHSALPNPNLDLYRALERQGCALLFLDGRYRGLEESSAALVSPDNLAGGYLAVRRLMQSGWTDIGLLFRGNDLQGLERYEGCVSAIRDYGLSMKDDCYFWYEALRYEAGAVKKEAVAGGFLSRLRAQCGAVICQDDEAAFWLYRRMQETNREQSEPPVILCFDEGYFAGTGDRPFLSLSCHKSHPGRSAARMLLGRIAGARTEPAIIRWEM